MKDFRKKVCLRRNLQRSVAVGLPFFVMLVISGCGGNSGVSMPSFSSSNDTENMFITAAATWDQNKDGTVTCEEWKSYAGELFQNADGDGDKTLNKDEYAKISKTDRLFEVADHSYFDGNNDGRVTLPELADKPNPAFTKLDRDKDCKIGRNEVVIVRGQDPTPKGGGKAPDITQEVPGR